MLLYTKRALPKAPKKRSRAGCEFCRVKKKKCDERRPVCARCEEAGQQCIYGPLRPRQRRSAAQIEADSASAEDSSGSMLSAQQTSAACPGFTQPALDDSWPGGVGNVDGDELAHLGLDDESYGLLDLDMVSLPNALALPNVVATWSPTHRHAGAFYATPHLELNMPLFSEFTTIKGRRGLLDHFSNVLSHLIVLREDGSNPFQQLVLPMSRQSPAVASAIYALSSAHLEFRGVAGVEKKSIEFHSEAARNLANLIERGTQGNQNELLAAVILLIYYEVLVHRERSQIVNGHLKGALAILNSVPATPDSTRALNCGPAPTDPTRAFLERAFRFYDVIAALSFRTPTLSAAPEANSFGHFLPVDSRGASQPAGSADALLGMATSLWPVVHQLSNLGALKDQVVLAETSGQTAKAERLRVELETTASAIETSLIAWEPELSSDQATNASGPLQGILNNARAYRHSALVHLHRSIYGARREQPTVQEHTHASLEFCVGTVESPGPMGALLWPLFVAACEAQTPADRAMATTAFEGIGRHQGMANIEQSWQIVEEVWRRADDAASARSGTEEEEDGGMAALGAGLRNSSLGGMRGPEFGKEDLWRQVCRDLGLAVVFG